MLLVNGTSPTVTGPVEVRIEGNRIASASGARPRDPLTIDLNGSLVFPGLINAHDHLDFNCFSPLGTRRYTSYREWGAHIHVAFREEIEAVRRIPAALRAEWGMYKNLLAGVTTVVQHGALPVIREPLLHIHRQTLDLHSVGFEKDWKRKLNSPLSFRSCAIHCGEGVDPESTAEINELIRANYFGRPMIGVHGVAMHPMQAQKFRALVWCPESNATLLGVQPAIQDLKRSTKILFGTDSTLTGHWNIWHHLRRARSLGVVDDEDLFAMATTSAAKVFGFRRGQLSRGFAADVVVAERRSAGAWDDFYSTDPESIELVIHQGRIRLFDESLRGRLLTSIDPRKFSALIVGDRVKFVEGNLPDLCSRIGGFNSDVSFPFRIPARALSVSYA